MSMRHFTTLLLGFSCFACTPAFAAPITFDVSGIPSFGEQGDPGNARYDLNVGANAVVTSVTFNVNLTAYAPSWLSEIRLAMTDSDSLKGVKLTPGLGSNNPGTASFASMLDLRALDLVFGVGTDGILRLEFYEGFSDTLFPDGIWNSGSITFHFAGDPVDPVDPGTGVPEPASALLIGAGLAMMAYAGRRRRTAGAAAV